MKHEYALIIVNVDNLKSRSPNVLEPPDTEREWELHAYNTTGMGGVHYFVWRRAL